MLKNNNKFKLLLIVFVLTIFSYLILEFSMPRRTLENFSRYLSNHKKLVTLSFLFLSSLNLLLLSITNNYIVGGFFFILTSVGLAVANAQKTKMRFEPVFPHELREIINIGHLFSMMDSKARVLSIVFIIFIVILIYYLFRRIDDLAQVHESYKSKYGAIAISTLILTLFFRVNLGNQFVATLLDKSGFIESRWNALQTYEVNGFVPGFIYNFPGSSMKKPVSYNKIEMESLYKKYESIANRINKDRKLGSFEDVNVVYILSESMSDPRIIPGIKLGDSPIPFIQSPENKNIVGKMLVPIYGGGTANTEFEILTSMSTKFLLSRASTPYHHILPTRDNFPSVLNEFNRTAHETIAAHNYHSNYYQRKRVFKNLGFTNQFFEEDMSYTDTLGLSKYIADEEGYKEILSYLESYDKSFIHFITMQNHTPYDDKNFELDFDMELEFTGNENTITNFVKGINASDDATKSFIEKVSKINKKTMVVLYGDHHPGLYNEFLENKESNDPRIEERLSDYFIYSNYNDEVFRVQEPIATYYLNNVVYRVADVKISPYMGFIEEFNKEFTGIISEGYVLRDGTVKPYEELSKTQKELVDEFILIQYDAIEGKNFFWNKNESFVMNKG